MESACSLNEIHQYGKTKKLQIMFFFYRTNLLNAAESKLCE